MKIAVGGFVVGVGFGVVTSLVNALSSPYSELGGPLTGTVWASAAKVLSLLIGVGWAWAALAVAMGYLAGTRVRGALVGALTLIVATGAYYVTDSLVLGDPLALYATALVGWSVAGLVFGLVLGVVGAAIRRPGLIGLLAALTVPVGAGGCRRADGRATVPAAAHLDLGDCSRRDHRLGGRRARCLLGCPPVLGREACGRLKGRSPRWETGPVRRVSGHFGVRVVVLHVR